ncbi:MAG: protein-disulfide reductase DsbD domain-containing protein, partial [Pyrinomonadaceae bacterium]
MLPLTGFAQNPISWKLDSDIKNKTLTSGENFKAKLSAELEEGWHLYAPEQVDGGPIATKITLPENSDFKLNGKIISPSPKTALDPNFQIETKFFEKQVSFELPLTSGDNVKGGDLAVNVFFQACNDSICLPPKTVKVTFSGFENVKKSSFSNPSSVVGNENSTSPNSTTNNIQQNSNSELLSPNESVWSFLWIAISLGALSLLTPCVFPMIPITVSYFTNHSSRSRAKAVKLAAVYSFG